MLRKFICALLMAVCLCASCTCPDRRIGADQVDRVIEIWQGHNETERSAVELADAESVLRSDPDTSRTLLVKHLESNNADIAAASAALLDAVADDGCVHSLIAFLKRGPETAPWQTARFHALTTVYNMSTRREIAASRSVVVSFCEAEMTVNRVNRRLAARVLSALKSESSLPAMKVAVDLTIPSRKSDDALAIADAMRLLSPGKAKDLLQQHREVLIRRASGEYAGNSRYAALAKWLK